ncbi:MAG: DUF4276 family protein [Blastocatellia bacterium]|nr:DUF4276 family protein [Blastocatellia bacterium]
MSNYLSIGIMTEGRTDTRFLLPLVERTFEKVAYECPQIIEVYPATLIDAAKEDFATMVLQAAQKASQEHCMVLCVHTDADEITDERAFDSKIQPAFEEVVRVADSNNNICQNLVPIVPVQMTEAWLLADTQLLKREINGTHKSDSELGIHRPPQSYPDPKETIREAIRRVAVELPKKRRNDIQIADLYQPIGEKITLDKLSQVPSFQKFMIAARTALHKLGYLPPV